MGSSMGAGKILKNFLVQLFVQNIWNFHSEQRPGMTLVLSSRSRKGKVVLPPRTSVNTNPYLASFLTGVIVREKHRKGVVEVSSILESSLAAQGDDVYWRILRPAALLAGILCVILGQPLIGLLVFFLGFNVMAQGERLFGYARGLKKGKRGLKEVLTSLGRMKKVLLPVSGALIGLLIASVLLPVHLNPLVAGGVEWYLFLPFFGLAFLGAMFRITPLLNLAVNLIVLVLLEVMI